MRTLSRTFVCLIACRCNYGSCSKSEHSQLPGSMEIECACSSVAVDIDGIGRPLLASLSSCRPEAWSSTAMTATMPAPMPSGSSPAV